MIFTDMMTYQCIEPIEPKVINGYMQQADLSDIDVIARYRADDLKEMNNICKVQLLHIVKLM